MLEPVFKIVDVMDDVYTMNGFTYKYVGLKAQTDEQPFKGLIPITESYAVGDVIRINKCKLIRTNPATEEEVLTGSVLTILQRLTSTSIFLILVLLLSHLVLRLRSTVRMLICSSRLLYR